MEYTKHFADKWFSFERFQVVKMFSCADKCDGTSSGCNAVIEGGREGGWGERREGGWKEGVMEGGVEGGTCRKKIREEGEGGGNGRINLIYMYMCKTPYSQH